MSASPHPLRERLAGLAARAHAGEPQVVELVGPGATSLAKAWTADDPCFRPTLPFREAPPETPSTLWFDGPITPVDLVLEWLCHQPRPCLVLLTGASCDAGRPDDRQPLTVDGAPSEATPTRIPVALDGPPEAVIERALAVRDLALAFAAFEQSPDLHDRWMLKASRLLQLGRHRELTDTLLTGTRLSAPAALLLGRSLFHRGETRRAYAVLTATLLTRPPDHLTADLEYVRQRCVQWHDAPLPTPVDGSLRDMHLHLSSREGAASARAALGDQESRLIDAAAPLRTGASLSNRRRAASGMIAIGQLLFARITHPGDWIPEPRLRAISRAVHAIQAGDGAAAVAALEAPNAMSIGHAGDYAPEWTHTRAMAAALQGDRLTLHSLCRQLQLLRVRDPMRVKALVRSATHADAWCRIHLWSRTGDAAGQPELMLADVHPSTAPPVVGDYELGEMLGKGGMGSVWHATFVPTDHPVALKLMTSTTPYALDLFRTEIDIVSRLDHPAIVSVLDHGVVHPLEAAHRPDLLTSGAPFLVMEHVEGGSLTTWLGTVDWDAQHAVLLALLDALAYAHASDVVHRDLKPANVLVDTDGQVRLTDFGLAGVGPGRVAGTPAYMAPEQFTARQVGPRADLFALGCLAWALATGAPPHFGTPTAIQAARRNGLPPFDPTHPVPAELEAWLRGLLAFDADARPSTAAEAAASLLELGEPVVVGRSTRRRPPPSSGSTTFALGLTQGLVGVGAPEIESDVGANARATSRTRVRHLFTREHPYRPRLPITSLLERGDPETVGQPEVRAILASRMVEAFDGRGGRVVVLYGPPGSGHQRLVRAVRTTLRIQGLDIGDAPGPGPALIFAGSDDLAEWSKRSEDQPWVVVLSRYGPVDGVESVPVRRLSRLELYWMVRARLPVEPWVALEIARRAHGLPGVAMQMLRDLVVRPGFRAGPNGVRPMGKLPDTCPSAIAAWGRAIRLNSSDRLEAARIAAILAPSFAASTWESACRALGIEQPGDLAWFATDLDGWVMSEDVSAAVLQGVSPAHLARLHRAASEVEHPGRDGRLLAARHAMLADLPGSIPEFRAAMIDQLVWGRLLPRGLSRTLQVHLDREGVPTEHALRGWLELAKIMDQKAWRDGEIERVGRPLDVARWAADRQLHALRAVALRLDGWGRPPGSHLDEMVRAGARVGGITRLLAGVCATAQRARYGASWQAEMARLDTLFDRSPYRDTLRTLIRLRVALHVGDIDLIPPDEVDVEHAAYHLMLRSHLLLADEKYAEAAAEFQRGTGISGTNRLNYALACAGSGELEDAATHAFSAAAHHAFRGIHSHLHVSLQVFLAAGVHTMPTRRWEDLLRSTPRESEPTLDAAMRRMLDLLSPADPRRQALERFMVGGSVAVRDFTYPSWRANVEAKS